MPRSHDRESRAALEQPIRAGSPGGRLRPSIIDTTPSSPSPNRQHKLAQKLGQSLGVAVGGPGCLDPRGGGGVLHDLFVTPFGGGAVRPRRGQAGESRCFDVPYGESWVEDDGLCEAQVRRPSGGVPLLAAAPQRHWPRRGIGADAALDRGSCRSGPCPAGAWCPGAGHSPVPRAKHGMPIPPVAVMLAEGLPVLENGRRCRAGGRWNGARRTVA